MPWILTHVETGTLKYVIITIDIYVTILTYSILTTFM